jgi:cobyrinic acid a,c-diamide synthase
MSAKLYGQASQMAESMGVKPLGYLSPNKNITLESRHLGLVTADEIIGLKKKMDMIASEMEKTIDIDGITELASTAPELKAAEPEFIKHLKKADVRIAVASDDAFCFTYRENIDLLELMGCEIVYFSPLHDTSLPENISGMILSGGYPELHAAELAANKEMLRQIHDAVTSGMPVIAECGGFMYLHEELEGGDGVIYRMAGAVKGRCFSTKTLQRFGYINLRACHSGMLCPKDSEMKAHEFHYWDSDNCGGSFIAEKPDGSRHWSCGILTDTMYAGFPHLFFYESPEIAERFVDKCLKRSLGK